MGDLTRLRNSDRFNLGDTRGQHHVTIRTSDSFINKHGLTKEAVFVRANLSPAHTRVLAQARRVLPVVAH